MNQERCPACHTKGGTLYPQPRPNLDGTVRYYWYWQHHDIGDTQKGTTLRRTCYIGPIYKGEKASEAAA